MPPPCSRRHFLGSALAASAGLLTSRATATPEAGSFSFVLLGDLHFDRLAHHDLGWLEKEKGGDLRQIQNYSRISEEITPQLFATVRSVVADLKSTTTVPFVLQVGDLVEGLCGSEERATAQNREALAFVRDAQLGVPFVFCKGNHDVTGPGAREAFGGIVQPFLAEQAAASGKASLAAANYTIEHGDTLFCFFDAYEDISLDWLEAQLTKRTARHCFVSIHPPVVPYGARATWHLYSSPKDRAKRDKLLQMLGAQNAFVLGGHIHRFNTLTRNMPPKGRFVQLAVSSVINSATVMAKTELSGVSAYTGDQIVVEPSFSPGTEEARKAVYDAERPFVSAFDYADLPGYTVVHVSAKEVTAEVYSGISRKLWRTISLSGAMSA